MLEFFNDSVIHGMPSFSNLLMCTVCSVIFGIVVAWVYMFKNKYSRSMAVTLVILPAVVQLVIMLVNGNIGAGIAVAGAFSLVRFRSVPGNARDISCLFFAMALGFASGMGFLGYAFVFLFIIGGVFLVLTLIRFGEGATDTRILRITIPENMNYDGLFDDVLTKYTIDSELITVRTVSMGSLYELMFSVRMKPAADQKAFIDELRCHNGNLNIFLSRVQQTGEEL